MKQQLEKTIVVVTALALIVVGCGPGVTPPPTQAPPSATLTAQVKSPEAVLRAITEALNKKDAEAATALVADDVMQTLIPAPSGTGIYQGKEAMRARFKEVVAGNPVHKLTNCQTTGDQVVCDATYADDSTKPLGFDLEFTVDAVVENGLLKTVIWKMTDASLAKMQAAMASAQLPPMTVTFAEDKCTFAGPTKVSVGKITLHLNVDGQSNPTQSYGLFIATFDKGKTLDDLHGLPAAPQPDWVHEVDKVEFSTNRTMATSVTQGPIYLICFNLTGAWKVIGAFGPIEVGK